MARILGAADPDAQLRTVTCPTKGLTAVCRADGGHPPAYALQGPPTAPNQRASALLQTAILGDCLVLGPRESARHLVNLLRPVKTTSWALRHPLLTPSVGA